MARLFVQSIFLSIFIGVLIGILSPAKAAESYLTQTTLDRFKLWVETAKTAALNKEGSELHSLDNAIDGLNAKIGGMCDQTQDAECPAAFSSQNSVLSGLSNAVIALYSHPPADLALWIRDTGQSLGFIPKQAYAQGVGFSGLAAMLPLWKAFRNIAYVLLSLVMLFVGFMVMFRKKIDPKTVVTVQNAIPRIVVALILVTFSYAIVGIMIDLMYLSIVLTASILAPASQGVIDAKEFTGQTLAGGLWQFFWNNFTFAKAKDVFGDIAALLSGNNPWIKYGAMVVAGVIGFLAGGPGGALLGAAAVPGLLYLIILLVLLFGVVRLVFLLVDAYIHIIIALLTAPLQLMIEAVPGTNAFSSWFRNLLAKLSVFPITAAILLISTILTSADNTKSLWAPPFLSAQGGTFGLAGLIGLGMLLVIPSIAAGVQKALKAEPVMPAGVGATIGPLGSAIGQTIPLIYYTAPMLSLIRHKPKERTPYQEVRESAEKGPGGVLGGGGR